MSKNRPGLTDTFMAHLMSYAYREFTNNAPGIGTQPAFFAAVKPILESAYTRGQNVAEWDRRTFQGTCLHPPEQRADAGGGMQACSRCGAIVAMEPPRKQTKPKLGPARATGKAVKRRPTFVCDTSSYAKAKKK